MQLRQPGVPQGLLHANALARVKHQHAQHQVDGQVVRLGELLAEVDGLRGSRGQRQVEGP
jgi:hypothetical protein